MKIMFIFKTSRGRGFRN